MRQIRKNLASLFCSEIVPDTRKELKRNRQLHPWAKGRLKEQLTNTTTTTTTKPLSPKQVGVG